MWVHLHVRMLTMANVSDTREFRTEYLRYPQTSPSITSPSSPSNYCFASLHCVICNRAPTHHGKPTESQRERCYALSTTGTYCTYNTCTYVCQITSRSRSHASREILPTPWVARYSVAFLTLLESLTEDVSREYFVWLNLRYDAIASISMLIYFIWCDFIIFNADSRARGDKRRRHYGWDEQTYWEIKNPEWKSPDVWERNKNLKRNNWITKGISPIRK